MNTYRFAKRMIDAALSFILLIVLLPVFVVTVILVAIGMGFPVFFRQMRTGLDSKPFLMYKFRTMRNLFDEEGNPLPDEVRVTGMGKFLRRSRLDELPELWNILKGDMSFVGPRPLLPEYLDRYTKVEARRHLIRPGLTGWAQCNGNTQFAWSEKMAMDVWYVDHVSLPLDMRVILRTVYVVLFGEHVNRKALSDAIEHANSLGGGGS